MTVERCPQTITGIRIARLLESQPALEDLEIATRVGTYVDYVRRLRFWHDAIPDAVTRYKRRRRNEARRKKPASAEHVLTRLAQRAA